MKKQFCIFFVFIVTTGLVSGQPAIEWAKCYGSQYEQRCHSFQQTPDGGFIIVGQSYGIGGDVTISLGSRDFWIVKTDSIGSIQWQKSYGGQGPDEALSVKLTQDGGYIVSGSVAGSGGFVTNYHGYNDLWVLKLDSAGLFQWQTCLGGTWNEEGFSILEMAGGGYIVAGSASSFDGNVYGLHDARDYWVVKLDSTGAMLWNKCYGGNKNDFAYDIVSNGSGGYVLAGKASSNGGDVTNIHVGGTSAFNPTFDFWIVNIDSSGNIIWEKCFGGTNNDIARDIVKSTDGGYIIAGSTDSNDGDVIGWHPGGSPAYPSSDTWVVKIDSMGTLEWQHCYGGSGGEAAYSLLQSQDGGYLVCGYASSNDGDAENKYGGLDVWLFKTDSAGNLLWQGCYGSSRWDYGAQVIQTYDGQYAICGDVSGGDGDVSGFHPPTPNNGDYWLVKLSDISITGMQPVICSQCVGSATAALTGGAAPFTYLWSNGQTAATIDSLCAGTYTITITDAFGITSTGYFIIPNDTVTVAMTQTSATCWNCPDGSATIIPQGGTGVYSYSWQGYPDTTPTLSGIPHNWYIGCVTDSLGCVICDSIEVGWSVGLPDIKEDFVSLTPNPASDNVVVNFSAGYNLNENYQLEIFTVQGKLIYSRKLFNESTLVDLSTVAEGLYFVRISTHGKSIVKKLVKNRM